jgi:hypothetical protein
VSPATSVGPGGGRGSAAAAAICLRQARCRATALAVCWAGLCHKCQRSATWTAAGAPRRGSVAGALGVGAGQAGTSRSSVPRCTAIPSAAASRTPARSASSSATWDSNPASVLRVLFG